MNTLVDCWEETDLAYVRSLPDKEAAQLLDGRLRALDRVAKTGFMERGIILREVQGRKLWQHLAAEDGRFYHSLDQWIVTAAPWSRRDCYAALGAAESLKEIPLDRLASIPRCNIALLSQLSSGVRKDPEVLKSARDLSENDFRATIKQEHPHEKIEMTREVKLKFTESQYSKVMDAVDLAIQHDDGSRIEDVIEGWAANYSEGK